MIDMRCLVLFVLLGVSGIADAQRLVTGTVYSYVKDGMRHYTSKHPGPAAQDVRAIKYSFVEVPAGTPDGKPLYKCPQPDGVPSYTAIPSIGCSVIGVYRPAVPTAPVRYFGGYPCTQDCSGHDAGYEWAERRGITDPDDCGGRSQSFIEGCQAYAEETQQRMIEDGECEDSDGDELCD